MTEYEIEPIPGLPGLLPPGERIVWQGKPEWRALARSVFHVRAVTGYFLVLAAVAIASGSLIGTAMTVAAGVAGVALLHLLAWGTARATIYTLTDKRVVLRIGMALPTCINLPLATIGGVGLTVASDGSGDLPLTLNATQRVGYAALWPHARPWRLATPEPMLRAVPDAAGVAAMIGRACLAAQPGGRLTAVETPRVADVVFPEAVAA